MTTAVQPAQAGFAAVVGDSRVISGAAECAAYAVDGEVPNWVVYPSSAEQVAGVLSHAAELGLAVVPFRNGLKISIGNPPRRFDVALSLKEMNHVWHYEPDDLTITVEAGMKLGDLQHFLARRRLWLPLDPPGGPRASLGGILATNSAGPLRLQYGSPRDMVLGMKIATTEGKLIKAGGRVVKNVAGYDLVKVLVGSYGTLGVIVEASLKLFPLPAERATFVASVRGLDSARELRRKILNSPLQPMRMALLDATAASLSRAGTPLDTQTRESELWLETGGTPRVIERSERELEALARDAGVEPRRLDSHDAEFVWERISDFRTWMVASRPAVLILKAALPPAASEDFLSCAREEAGKAGLFTASFGQTAVGIIYLCLWADRETVTPWAPLISDLRQKAQSVNGALIVEQCPSELKSTLDVWGPAGDDLELMRQLKLAWDPKQVLSPGRFLGGL